MWNYRVVRKRHVYKHATQAKEKVDYAYGIHEAFYDENGYIGSITEHPVEPFGEDIEGLRHSWVMMAEAFGQPVLDYDNIPEPGCERKRDPVGSELDKRREDFETGDEKGIPWEDVKKELEDKQSPFNEEAYSKQAEKERIEKEKIHNENFVGTPTLEGLIKKVYDDYKEHRNREGE